MKKRLGAILLVGIPEHDADLEYAGGFRAGSPVVLLCIGVKKYLVVVGLEYGRACKVIHSAGKSGRVKVLNSSQLGLKGRKAAQVSEWALKVVQDAGVRRVTVPGSFPHAVARRLTKAGIQVIIAKQPLFPRRQVKTREELARITQSQQAAVIAIRSAITLIAKTSVTTEGFLKLGTELLTSETVRRVISGVLLEHGCFSRETIVAGGRQAVNPHDVGSGPLPAHEAIIIDIFPQHLVHGYWGDLTRTVVKGKPSAKLKKMYQAVKAAQSSALARIKPGVQAKSVHMAAVEEFSHRRYETRIEEGVPIGFIHSTGHGVGLAIHELPTIGSANTRLKSGNVVTVEPGLYYPDLGGIRIEDTVVVTPTGWRYLVPCEKKFEI